ncbi:hypothetical protein QTP70_004529 [Hemibagrus guttatus]|uniref:ribonuclease H n=1 Tax=Hemibagrus guttatus TaxID=175788 RepID=A0AAE0Q076_9TELE|nr:hypothetical protein QTP70_004529 [Hemibagrus guttatus]
MNSAVYQKILKENVRPSVCDLKLKRTWVLQQDNDPKHTSKSTSEWLKKNKMKTLEWPSQSPDLNPNEMLWHDLKKVVHARKPSNVAELQQFCKDEWAKIPPQRCNRLIASYQKRLIAVVAAKDAAIQLILVYGFRINSCVTYAVVLRIWMDKNDQVKRKSTTDAIFALRILMEKYRDGQRELHCVFVDLEKAYDRVPREELWYCMRKSGVAEKYVRVVQDMYERSRTVVRCAVGQTEEFKVEVGLHQGSALSPFLFAIVMDQLSEEVRQESPWTMMFADDIVICSESREQVEENLERWRFALERRGMKVSRSKTEYMCVNEREGSGTVRLQGEEVKKVQEFKYLGSTVQSNGECGKEVKKRVQAGWNGWRKVSGVLCDQKISARIKGKVYRTVVRPAMLYGLETVSLRKRQESELEVAELKMFRFSLGVTRLDRIRNEYIRGTAHVGRLGDKVREARLRWFGHVQRRDSEYIGRRMLDMDVINEDMKLVGARVEDAEDRDRWREMIRCGDP